MRIRNILFGYEVKNGNIVVNQIEANVVRMIYEMYLSGKTLKQISDHLTVQKIIYYCDNAVWSKNIIARILDDSRYCGDSKYEKIISHDLYENVRQERNDRSAKKTQLSPLTKIIKGKLVCSVCGQSLGREKRRNNRGKWVCHGGCKFSTYLDDTTLFCKILNLIKSNITDTQDKASYEPTIDITRIKNEIYYILDQPNLIFEETYNIILDYASAKYDCCIIDKNSEITKMIISEYALYDNKDCLDEALIEKTIDKIFVYNDGKIKLLLKSGAEIK